MSALPSLRRKADFAAVTGRGSARSNRLLALRYLPTDGPTRIGFSTPRTLGGAVERNRVRRRLRELLRARYGEMEIGWDLLLIARPAAARASFSELQEALGSLLRRSGITTS